jgi:hypothetical protein
VRDGSATLRFPEPFKGHAIAKGNSKIAGKTGHGLSSVAKPKAIPGSLIKFENTPPKRPGVFQELLQHFKGNLAVIKANLSLGYLLSTDNWVSPFC